MKLVKRAITVTRVLSTALKIVKSVDTQTALALVRRGGWDTIVPQGKYRFHRNVYGTYRRYFKKMSLLVFYLK